MRGMRALLALEGDAEGSKAMAIEMVKDLQKPGKTGWGENGGTKLRRTKIMPNIY